MAAPATSSRQSTAEPTAPSLRIAAIDVGSNSIHMIVAQADADGAITTLWRMKEMVGLGRMSFPSQRLSDESMDRAITALARFQQAAQQRQCEKIVAVATSAIREAQNGGDFIQRCKRELNLYVRLVSAREEARLIYLAVRHAVPLGADPHLIIDIGGGSVEFIVGNQSSPLLLESRKLGAARMTAQFVHSDPVSEQDMAALMAHYDHALTPLARSIEELKPVKAIGTSGTLENLAAMSNPDTSSNGHDGPRVIERGRFEEMLQELVKSRAKDRAKFTGLDDQRQEQIIAGAALVSEIFKRLNLKRIHLCDQALREGILLDYLSRHMPDLAIRREVPDPRRRSVLDLARRCHDYQSHSQQVARICLSLFDELKPLHGLSALDRELIEYAALLHDIGWHIARPRHHKHSMYLILNGDLRNFTKEEVQTIANIARYHRKATPRKSHKSYQSLSARARRVVDVGGSLLRLADGLDRSHGSVVQSLRCAVGDKKVKCTLNARTDAQLEVWGARQKTDFFEKVFDRKITFDLAGASGQPRRRAKLASTD